MDTEYVVSQCYLLFSHGINSIFLQNMKSNLSFDNIYYGSLSKLVLAPRAIIRDNAVFPECTCDKTNN